MANIAGYKAVLEASNHFGMHVYVLKVQVCSFVLLFLPIERARHDWSSHRGWVSYFC